MHVIFLHVECASRPGIGFTETTDFLFHKRGKLANENLFPIIWTPDEVIGQFVGDVFGVLCIHTRQYNMCSKSCEVPGRAALPLDELLFVEILFRIQPITFRSTSLF
jgi:hypothetical protein